MLFVDGLLINDRVAHIQRINVQLERLEPCLQIADNKPNKSLYWGLMQSEWELRKDTDEVCKQADIIIIGNRLDSAFLEVIGISDASQIKDVITVKLPNGKEIGSIPKGTTKEQVKLIAIKSGLATEQDFTPSKGRNPFDQFDSLKSE